MFGGALGSGARYLLNGWVSHRLGETFPVGTLVINVLGSFLIGFVATLTAPEGRYFAGSTTRQFVMTGILGGFTTFSSFSLQTLNLARDGEWWLASLNCVLSLVLCLLGVWLGHVAAATVNR
jgi:CrcB protein